MESRAKAFGHAIHPMLIVFPLGLLATAVIFDLIYLGTDNEGLSIAAAYVIAAGLIGGAIAALFGLIDYLAIPRRTRAKRVGLLHGLGNFVVLVLFLISFALRANETNWHQTGPALTFSFIGAAIALLTAWLGGELVERLGVGVTDNAGLNASSSLSPRQSAAAADHHEQ
jgi:uncharacterized membrane protein